jgi:GNAT superfamily N-acetyltransferase
LLSCREVRTEDVSQICTFPQGAEELFFLFPKASYPLTPEQLCRSIELRFDSTVVLLDGRVRGFANFYVREPAGTCAIGNVVVDPEARGKGVGTYLIESMIRTALLRHQAGMVRISCFNRNASGLLLYAKLGFEPFAVEPRLDKQDARVALIHMRLSDEAASRYREEVPRGEGAPVGR